MKKEKYCIAIMSIGSGVGQSVITSCNVSSLPLYTIGFGMNPFAFGGYDCDEMDYVPLIYAEDYIPELIRKCHAHQVDLIIPGSDDEAHILSQHASILEAEGFKVLVSKIDLMNLVRDKEKMCEVLTPVADIFVKSYYLNELEALLDRGEVDFPLIAKPRGGYASRGVEILLDKKDLGRLNENHIIQEVAIPRKGDPNREAYLAKLGKRQNPQIAEISAQVVTDVNGHILGKMCSYNKLNNGVPIEMVPYEDEYVWSEMNKLLPELRRLGHRGPLNIQGRWTDNGLKLYEMNARFTGITGWRALLGFNEVESCIKSWLGIHSETNPLEMNYRKFGSRQTTDKAISLDDNAKIKELSVTLNQRELKPKKTLFITGAGGFLGQAIINKLIHKPEYEVLAFDLTKEENMLRFAQASNVTCYDNLDLEQGLVRLGSADILLHCGFARPHCTEQQIADSLKFTAELFSRATLTQISAIINISSQSVYGTKQNSPFHEENPTMPENAYSQAKYASELLLNQIKTLNKNTNSCNIRLATLSGGQSGLVPVDILAKFVQQAIKGEPIQIMGGHQRMERLDVRDAADAIIALLACDKPRWSEAYNLGPGKVYTIREMAEMVGQVSLELYHKDVCIEIKESEVHLELGMDISSFTELTGWQARYDIRDIVMSLFDYLR